MYVDIAIRRSSSVSWFSFVSWLTIVRTSATSPPRIGGLDDDGDDPPDHRGLHALRKEAQRLRRGDAPRDLGRHLFDFRGELAVAASRGDDDGLRECHAEAPGLRDIAEEVREPAFDLL